MSPRPADRPRRPRRRGPRLVAAAAVVAVGAAVLPVLVEAAPQWVASAAPPGARIPAPVTSVPADDPAKGRVHAGLRAAKPGGRCAGGFELAVTGECTHGPDAPPPGVDPRVDSRAVAPAERSASVGAAAGVPTEQELAGETTEVLAAAPGATPPATAPAASAAAAVPCEGDGQSGKRVQVLYLYGAGSANRFDQYVGSIRSWAAGADEIYRLSAQDTGGVRHIRYVTEADCQLSVVPVEIPAGSIGSFDATISALRQRGFNRRDRKYMIFADSRTYCGIGTHVGDETKGAGNRNNTGPSYGRTDAGCWGASTPAHELGHNLGAVNQGAPNTSGGGHCTDEYDVMCYSDSPNYPQMRTVCPDRSFDRRLDCQHDDYYNTAPKPGSYLATNWNTADNAFLMTGTGSGAPPPPTAPPTAPSPTAPPAAPTPPVTPTAPPASPAPTPTASPTVTPPPAGRELTVGQVSANAVRLSWRPATTARAEYGVQVGGRTAGRTFRTAVTVRGLVPGTDYRFRITVRDRTGRERPHTTEVTVRTPPLPRPARATPVLLTNSLTGMAVDAFGGSNRAGTPLIQYAAHGYANQRWTLRPAAGGTVTVRSEASGACIQPFGGRLRAQTVVVQAACDGSTAQRWKVGSTRYGQTLGTADGRLVLGVGDRRHGGERMLALQQPTGSRYQIWTMNPR